MRNRRQTPSSTYELRPAAPAPADPGLVGGPIGRFIALILRIAICIGLVVIVIGAFGYSTGTGWAALAVAAVIAWIALARGQ